MWGVRWPGRLVLSGCGRSSALCCRQEQWLAERRGEGCAALQATLQHCLVMWGSGRGPATITATQPARLFIIALIWSEIWEIWEIWQLNKVWVANWRLVLDWSQAGNSQNSSSEGSTSLNPPELQANQRFKTSFSDPAGELVSDRHSPPVELVTFRGTKFCDCQTAESR